LDTGQKKCWLFVLGILDDCKCSENFLAQTIITPILLSTTFLIQIVDGLIDYLKSVRYRLGVYERKMKILAAQKIEAFHLQRSKFQVSLNMSLTSSDGESLETFQTSVD
jgi:hypothetical protein